jgi:hypothetical protein
MSVNPISMDSSRNICLHTWDTSVFRGRSRGLSDRIKVGIRLILSEAEGRCGDQHPMKTAAG